MKTTPKDIVAVCEYLKTQVGWTEIDKIKKAIGSKLVAGMKIEAMKFLGLLDRDVNNVKLTDAGRSFANGSDAERAQVITQRLRAVPLYNATLEWLHFSQANRDTIPKTDIANYWHDNHPTETGGAVGDALTDASVFFMRMVGLAGLGTFVAAGAGRDTHLNMNADALRELVTSTAAPGGKRGDGKPGAARQEKPLPPPQSPPPANFGIGAGLNVRVEIHIAADAKPATIEEIFKNMRKYLMPQSSPPDGG